MGPLQIYKEQSCTFKITEPFLNSCFSRKGVVNLDLNPHQQAILRSK